MGALGATISIMGGASLAAMAAEKIANECGKPNIAQYISLFVSSSLAVTALTAACTLINFIAGL